MPQLPGRLHVPRVLAGLAIVRRIRAEGSDARYDPETRTLISADLGDVALAACARDCDDLTDPRPYLREHLRHEGLVKR